MDPATMMAVAGMVKDYGKGAMMTAGAIGSALVGAMIPDALHKRQNNMATQNLLSPNKRTIQTQEWFAPGKFEKIARMVPIGIASLATGGTELADAIKNFDQEESTSGYIQGKPNTWEPLDWSKPTIAPLDNNGNLLPRDTRINKSGPLSPASYYDVEYPMNIKYDGMYDFRKMGSSDTYNRTYFQ